MMVFSNEAINLITIVSLVLTIVALGLAGWQTPAANRQSTSFVRHRWCCFDDGI